MNNDQFRRLVNDGSSKIASNNEKPAAEANGSTSTNSRPSMFMAPRNTKTSYFQPNQIKQSSKQLKSFAPKGVRLVAGYKDRTQDRIDDDADEKAKKIKDLEKKLKDEEIDQEEFERLRDEITGGEVENTHLVKGLDFKLLERIRRGEDINSKPETDTPEVDDDDFDEFEKKEITTAAKEQKEKKGILAPAAIAGVKRTRDQILADLKASRKKAAAVPEAEQLGSRFRKISDKPEKKSIKPASKQVPKLREEEEPAPKLVPLDHDVFVPKAPTPEVESEESDIFSDAGDDYNPLGDDSGDEAAPTRKEEPAFNTKVDIKQTRTYFDDDSTSVLDKMKNPYFNNPSVVAALARKGESTDTKEEPKTELTEEEERLKRRAEMLNQEDRDLDDIDMGFGASRFDDAEDMEMEGSKLKLSEWKGGQTYDDEDDDEPNKNKEKKDRKRKPKKRKGDKNNMADVMRVIEGRKG
jgi:hypothetical protein